MCDLQVEVPFLRACFQVDEAHMGKGLGGQLIDAAEDYSQRCSAAHKKASRMRKARPKSMIQVGFPFENRVETVESRV